MLALELRAVFEAWTAVHAFDEGVAGDHMRNACCLRAFIAEVVQCTEVLRTGTELRKTRINLGLRGRKVIAEPRLIQLRGHAKLVAIAPRLGGDCVEAVGACLERQCLFVGYRHRVVEQVIAAGVGGAGTGGHRKSVGIDHSHCIGSKQRWSDVERRASSECYRAEHVQAGSLFVVEVDGRLNRAAVGE